MDADEIMRLRKQLLKAVDGDETTRVVEILKALKNQPVNLEILESTKIGKPVNKLRKHENKEIAKVATVLVEQWKQAAANGAERKERPSSQPAKSPSPSPPASGSSAGTPRASPQNPPGPRPSSTGVQSRDKVREILWQSIGQKYSDEDHDPHRLAADIEQVMFDTLGGSDNSAYKGKARSLKFNLSDPKNPELNRRVLAGVITPATLVAMDAKDMASDDLKKFRRKAEQDAMESRRSDWNQVRQKQEKGMFVCGKCKSDKTTYYQMQTRSADEPMTTFVTCLNCGNRWKF
eukprot:GILK01004762.1.p1 GENE.GILK01004762.1~~GILK01004762.1.p1  ORF type:complete len:291 (-),score=57.42 GILK01004762.1:149-1021(-)